jgi:hypothetical protein
MAEMQLLEGCGGLASECALRVNESLFGNFGVLAAV